MMSFDIVVVPSFVPLNHKFSAGIEVREIFLLKNLVQRCCTRCPAKNQHQSLIPPEDIATVTQAKKATENEKHWAKKIKSVDDI
ncbi:hypothetical protein KIN20_006836 [Parelaphostrongylus tenuis]|uniref:Uncharacterized protein n=1 Tax=Parelaphostrongylus tenuis TaxID=148309 RepID=A0AAD5QIN4_PARTN|nr:hypothetical protein KIN20_006836 [Parelaphostrongylus tenuis]